MSVEIDPELDPEERLNKFYALGSAALGLLSLCAAIVPVCGGVLGLAGIVLGFFGRRSENKKMAAIGIVLSAIGLLTAVVYAAFVYIAGS
ncbi:MAG: DUF4190 domain-containing protein [Chloroflexi bacterium]|nr:DUF4190 domain-containing protein [Chloroflexota bacterium]